MKVEIFLEVLLAIICACQSSTLVVDVVEISNKDSYTFVCNLPSSTNLTRWTYLDGYAVTSLMSYQNGTCTVTSSGSFLSNNTRYSYACNSSSYQVTFNPSPDKSLNNHILACEDAHQLNIAGSTWIIKTKTDGVNCSYCQPTISFDVIEIPEGDNAQFVCSVPSSVSYVNWNRNMGSNTAAMNFSQHGTCNTHGTTFLDNTSRYIYACNSTVYQVIIFNVTRNEHNDIYMCTPMNWTEGKGSNWILKVVKAQVTTVTIMPFNYLIYITENKIVEFSCSTSTARPAASVFWYMHPYREDHDITRITNNIFTSNDYNDLSVTTSKLRLFVTRHYNDIKVFCTANNLVNTTELRSTSKRLNVLYTSDDPYIVEGREYHAIEYTNGNLSCSVKGGNPTPTLSWSCNKFSPTNQSTINSNENVTTTLTWKVSRYHDGQCTCKSHQTGFTEKSVDVRLVVLYEATIKSFTINGIVDTSMTVNENDQVNFICTADSNPEAVMTLSHQSKILETVTSNNVEYNIDKARCSDAGTNYCSATNKYIGEKFSTQTVKLFINCAPRAAGEVNTNITSANNASNTFTANVIAYPPPWFTWSQLMNGMWTPLDKNDKFVISSSAVQSNLTIHRVGMDDFTIYRVIVKNKVGQIEQNFTLSPYGIPDTPTEFRQIQSHTTTSSIHIEWRPGYNGGPIQKFNIKYKKNSDTVWTYFTVIDSGEETMNISLTGLADDTQYDIVIFASNIIGNSSESPVLIVSTKVSHTNLGPLIGGIAGGVTACLIIVFIVIVSFRRYTSFKECGEKKSRGKSDGTNDTAGEHAYYNTGRLADIKIENNDAPAYDEIERVPNYEMVKMNNVDSPQYSTLDQTEQCTTTDTSSVDNKAVYENMKIQVF